MERQIINGVETKKKAVYVTPSGREVPLRLENALCGSPLPGGNEDIGYDDWD
jgi:hypothetical protein